MGTVTWLGGDQLQNFLALVGGFCCASLALIFPAMLNIAICKPRGFGLWLDGMIFLSGISSDHVYVSGTCFVEIISNSIWLRATTKESQTLYRCLALNS